MPEENQPVVVSRPKLRVALIHNHDAGRLAHIRPALAGLGDATLTEVSEQPPLAAQTWPMLVWRKMLAWRLQRRWRAYREQPQYFLPLDLLRLPRDIWRARDRTKGQIEIYLSDKHTRAWRDFLGSNDNALLVLEDDAVFRPDTALGLGEALALLDERPAYLDLAGGFPRAALGVERLEAARTGRFIEYRKPVTNTTAGYLINRALAGKLVGMLDANPRWNLFTADWMLNRCFVEGLDARCFHAEPTIFVHGSHAGTYSSTLM